MFPATGKHSLKRSQSSLACEDLGWKELYIADAYIATGYSVGQGHQGNMGGQTGNYGLFRRDLGCAQRKFQVCKCAPKFL